LVHVTVAVYVVANDPVAFVLPTPASSYELHETNCVAASTVHVAVPTWKWVPSGAFAGLIVVVTAAQAAEAKRATISSGKPPTIPILRILLINSPVRCSSS
jgi:hypothetical protein